MGIYSAYMLGRIGFNAGGDQVPHLSRISGEVQGRHIVE